MEHLGENYLLPANLQRRITRLVHKDEIIEEAQVTADTVESPDEDESKCSFDGNITNLLSKWPPKHVSSQKRSNWLVEFCRQTPKDRVKWNSKLHHSRTRFSRKPMYEQAEDLIDIAAGDFADQINKLCNDRSQHLSKEMIKRLFSIEIENDLSHSMTVNAMVRPAVRAELAIMFDCPQLSIEHRIQKLMVEDAKMARAPAKYHAFGRCLSPASKQYRADKATKAEPFDFPADIRSGKVLFNGIEHLRSTRALIKHLDDNNLPKPKYLMSIGAFGTAPTQSTSDNVALHSLYQ